MPKEVEVLKAIEEGVQTTEELCRRFDITSVHAAVLLSRYLEKGVVIRHGSVSSGRRGHPRIIFRLSKDGEDRLETERLRAQLKAKQEEVEELKRRLSSRE